MSKLQDMITKALKGDLGAVAKDPQTIVPKGDSGFNSGLNTDEQNRIAEIAYIAKALGNGKINAKAKSLLDAKKRFSMVYHFFKRFRNIKILKEKAKKV